MSQADSRIVWHRESSFFLSARNFNIKIDSEVRGTLSNGQSLAIDVSPGDHSIQLTAGRTKFDEIFVRIGPGQEFHVSSSFAGMGWRQSWHFKLEVDKTITRHVIETERYEVEVGNDEVRSVDNLLGESLQVRGFSLGREWSRSISIGSTESTAVSQIVEFRTSIADAKTQLERRIEQNYNMTGQQRQTFQDTLTITAAPRTYSEVRITWKEIRQRGYVDEFDGGVSISRTPFELIVGLTYDSRQIDRHSS